MKKLLLAATVFIAAGAALVAFRSAPSTPGKITAPAPAPRAGKWTLDKSHSNVRFTITHNVVSELDGAFTTFDGSLESTKADYSDAKITFTIEVASISTYNENRDKHLKSADFFDAEKFPQIKFESTAFKPLGGNKYKLEGNMTVKDITKAVSFDVTFGGTINTQRGAKAGFKAKTTINRFDYNLKWDRATEAGGLVVGKDVEVTINTELNEVK
ncbi:polyisoprenoid-binding protein [Paraflavitalea soli]|uniref:Polyisoprenoid-binding protein n=1 Tax=Paraflavitalea soli TaxID=2315862 RepID=A0A3B7MU89_9BACT|nr:YceI family protein [Paraflavitalea soli]AXY76953.1 polyisoprenoid-binding protein [Paraflavitalea soli]